MSTKISLILIVLLALFMTACSSTVASDPARVSSTNQENTSFIPVTGENISETSSNEALSANDASDISLDEKQVQISGCVLDGDLPRHIGGCVDFFSPNLNVDKNIPDDPCTSEVDLPHHRNGCD
jgi:hypothetical protein